ncbi:MULTISPECIES: GNAT family N-acetyltransferase [unclassified Legionella]|uniref:GNAT family N-acetyltransferase n=1 Tax=unclassified Legionella TaxID=2622702 RepID=UPI001055AD37|nr:MULTISPECIES: GNAT family N-acetyltransferase [unclassified Legionella]MDI9819786.1 GNAT family N-acetyltransferase [Legionella sp. PL877]
MIICNNQLDEDQLTAVGLLTEACHSHDGGTPILYKHLLTQKRDTENNVLLFENHCLIGFLSVYFFYEDACEVSLMVTPSHRRQGIASRLLKTILPLLIAKEIKTLIFSTAAAMDKNWLQDLGFSYRNSEAHMQRHSYEPILMPAQNLRIRKAVLTDIADLCAIDEACFSGQQSNMLARFHMILNDSNYTVLLALHNELVVGKAHIHWQTQESTLSDIAILPQYQGRGWGSELLAYCINHAITSGQKRLILDVETTNHHAFNLYLRHGFKIVNLSDYWIVPLEKLKAALQI